MKKEPIISWEKRKGRKSKKPSNYEIKLHYIDLNMSAEECAKKWNVTPSTVYRWVSEAKKETGGGLNKKRILSA